MSIRVRKGILFRSPNLHPKNIRPNIKVCNIKWYFHLNDKDFWPSVPHGHSFDQHGLKLDIDTGIIYKISTRKYWGIAGKGELDALFKIEKFNKFVKEAKENYQNRRSRQSLSRQRFSKIKGPVFSVMIQCEKGLT